MPKRKRRSAQEVAKLRDEVLKAVLQESSITLTQLVQKYGSKWGIANTPNDKNLLKRQLRSLAKEGQLSFQRRGRDLVASASTEPAAAPAPKATPRAAPRRKAAPTPVVNELDAVRAYASQLEEFARSLQDQINTLVRMLERAGQK